MASEKQGRYLEFLMVAVTCSTREADGPTAVMDIARRVDLDVQRASPRHGRSSPVEPNIPAKLSAWRWSSASKMTPAFVLGDSLDLSGAVDGARLKELIARARSGGLRR